MAFKLGKQSKLNMKGVHPDIISLVEYTIKRTPVDFTILRDGGLRTSSMQMALYKRGASKLNGKSVLSKHQKQTSGFGEAIDLVPWVGSPRWEWPLIYPIAATMAMGSRELGIEIRWGGVWDRELDELLAGANCFESITNAMKRAVSEYTVRHAGPDFIDGPHYELLH